MAAARRREQWAHTAELLAAVYNTIRDSKERPEPFSGRDFNPTLPPREPKRRGIEAFGVLVGFSDYGARKAAGALPSKK
jgi:hypothetical protein